MREVGNCLSAWPVRSFKVFYKEVSKPSDYETDALPTLPRGHRVEKYSGRIKLVAARDLSNPGVEFVPVPPSQCNPHLSIA